MNFNKEANKFGGTDLGDWGIYKKPDEQQYCNKPDHLIRSCIHQPNHSRIAKRLGIAIHSDMNSA